MQNEAKCIKETWIPMGLWIPMDTYGYLVAENCTYDTVRLYIGYLMPRRLYRISGDLSILRGSNDVLSGAICFFCRFLEQNQG